MSAKIWRTRRDKSGARRRALADAAWRCGALAYRMTPEQSVVWHGVHRSMSLHAFGVAMDMPRLRGVSADLVIVDDIAAFDGVR